MSEREQDGFVAPEVRGIGVLYNPALNKGTAFTEEERDLLGIRGLLPPRVFTQAEQVDRAIENLRRKPDDLERYVFLQAMQDRNETLFYRLLIDHLEDLLPIVYTPTVGEACLKFGLLLRRSRGLYITNRDRGRIAEVVANWPAPDVRVVVVTDGERILGLGDLGINGMGIPIGKLALYTACAGVPPSWCLPIALDVGTDNEAVRNDPLYGGLPQSRVRGEEYDALVDELITALRERYPHLLIQLEDFATPNAFRLLERYRKEACLFDDDIQGTAAVTLAALRSALRLSGGALADQRILFAGAGQAGIGIAELFTRALEEEGIPEAEVRRHCWFADVHGLITSDRTDLDEHVRRFAHAGPQVHGFAAMVREVRPTAIIGVSGARGLFDTEVLGAMAELNRRPIVFALSNPTSQSECTAEQAYAGTGGRAIFASGSPFPAVVVDGRRRVPGQANNAYIFPGVGLGVVAARARQVTEEMFLAAADALVQEVSKEDLALDRVFPPLSGIRDVSVNIATAVAEVAFREGLAEMEEPEDLAAHVRSVVYDPTYPRYGI